MRTAYVGLSTPLLYDYEHPTRIANNAWKTRYPNPILDSPFGLMLLYDQIWFLCRDFCPKNMRDLEYVKFLDEEQMLPDLTGIHSVAESAAKRIWDDPNLEERSNKVRSIFQSYEAVCRALGVHWKVLPDNHSTALQIGPITALGNSLELENILFDIEVVKQLRDTSTGVELVANSFGQYWLEESNPAIRQAALAQVLVIENIPNYLTPEGPYHRSMDEARENQYLVDFRDWVSSTADLPDAKDLQEVKTEVEEAIRRSRDDLFLRYLNPRDEYLSVGKALAGDLVGMVLPGAGTVEAVVESFVEARKKKALRWQGFLVSLSRQQRS